MKRAQKQRRPSCPLAKHSAITSRLRRLLPSPAPSHHALTPHLTQALGGKRRRSSSSAAARKPKTPKREKEAAATDAKGNPKGGKGSVARGSPLPKEAASPAGAASPAKAKRSPRRTAKMTALMALTGQALRNALVKPEFLRWCMYEFFYSSVDR